MNSSVQYDYIYHYITQFSKDYDLYEGHYFTSLTECSTNDVLMGLTSFKYYDKIKREMPERYFHLGGILVINEFIKPDIFSPALLFRIFKILINRNEAILLYREHSQGITEVFNSCFKLL